LILFILYFFFPARLTFNWKNAGEGICNDTKGNQGFPTVSSYPSFSAGGGIFVSLAAPPPFFLTGKSFALFAASKTIEVF